MSTHAWEARPAAGLDSGESRGRGRVRQIDVPAVARVLCTLPRVDYADAHLLATDRAQERTAQQWARALLTSLPAPTRRALRWSWFALGIRLGPADDERLVLGWEIRRSAPDFVLLGAGSRLGLEGQILLLRRHDELALATFLRLANPAVRAVWAATAPQHRQVVRHVLGQASRT